MVEFGFQGHLRTIMTHPHYFLQNQETNNKTTVMPNKFSEACWKIKYTVSSLSSHLFCLLIVIELIYQESRNISSSEFIFKVNSLFIYQGIIL